MFFFTSSGVFLFLTRNSFSINDLRAGAGRRLVTRSVSMSYEGFYSNSKALPSPTTRTTGQPLRYHEKAVKRLLKLGDRGHTKAILLEP